MKLSKLFKSVSWRLIVSFLLTAALAVSVILFVFLGLFGDNVYSERKEYLLRAATELSEIVSLRLGDEAQLADDVGEYVHILKNLLNAKVWIAENKDGNWSFWRIKDNMTPSKFDDFSLNEKTATFRVISGETVFSKDFANRFGEDTLSVLVPITAENNYVIGIVFIHAPYESLSATTVSAQRTLYVSAFAALCFAMLIAIMFSLRFTQPIRRIVNSTSEISKGNYGLRIKCNTGDEFELLSGSINALTSQLQKKIESIRDEKSNLDNIIENVSDGIAAFDLDLNITKSNATFMKFLIDPMRNEDFINFLHHIIDEKDSVAVNLVSGGYILSLAGSPMFDNDVLVGIVVVVRDISQTERLEQMRKEFVANVSHEFRTPLTIIRGSVEAIEDGLADDPDTMQEYLHKINGETHALEVLVKDLLDLSRFQAGKMSVNMLEIDIRELVSGVVAGMQLICAQKNVRLVYDEEFIKRPIVGDYDRLRQLVIIFIDNAIKFTPTGGHIDIEVYSINNEVVISVADTGIGIKKEDIPYIFERFYKADKARTGNAETGTGLGLSIAKQIVSAHNGYIEVESQIGKGTKFIIHIPYPD